MLTNPEIGKDSDADSSWRVARINPVSHVTDDSARKFSSLEYHFNKVFENLLREPLSRYI